MKSVSFFKRSRNLVMVGLFFVGLQAPISMQAMGVVTRASAANKLRKASATFLSVLKSGKTVAIGAAVLTLIALLAVMATQEGSLLPGTQQPPERQEQIEEVQAVPQPSSLQVEFGTLLNNPFGNADRLVQILKTVTLGGEKLNMDTIIGIGNSPLVQNYTNKGILQKFFLDKNKISQNYASKEVALEAEKIFGPDLSFKMRIRRVYK